MNTGCWVHWMCYCCGCRHFDERYLGHANTPTNAGLVHLQSVMATHSSPCRRLVASGELVESDTVPHPLRLAHKSANT